MAERPHQHQVPRDLRPVYEAITTVTDEMCHEHLTDEYGELVRSMTAALCRKRPSPLAYGNLTVWACAIVHTVGGVNFLFDPSQTPHMTATDLASGFGVSKSTVAAKVATIRRLLRVYDLEPRWTLPSRLANNPLVWMVMDANGFIVDIRTLPRAVQEAAVHQGAIPYLP
ncbi:MAG TPA: DUF6398 domain-containing protein [Chloroflexota bacterium]|nr:DUF6398 domain-containing protein [Chloroflexota bacterium]